MTKADMVTSVAEADGRSKNATEQTLSTFFAKLTEVLAAGDQFAWPGFGSFKVVDRAAREGRNPQTGATIQIPAAKAAKFTPAQGLRDIVKD